MKEFIAKIEEKIKMLEQNLAQATQNIKTWTDGCHGLKGMIQANMETLEDAKKLYEQTNPLEALLDETEDDNV